MRLANNNPNNGFQSLRKKLDVKLRRKIGREVKGHNFHEFNDEFLSQKPVKNIENTCKFKRKKK